MAPDISLSPLAAVDGLACALDGLVDVDLVGVDRDGLLEVLRRFETVKRRMAVLDHALVAQLDDRRIAAELCAPSTASLLRGLLRISPAEAGRRVRAAADLGPRRTMTGQPLPPLFARVAAAQARGAISAEHAVVITKTIEKLPYAVEVEHGRQVEATLVECALALDPVGLNVAARRVRDFLDPDGTLADDADHERHRDLSLTRP
jgi:Domain of unknown function (DUF222)